MAKLSAGILVVRRTERGIEVFLVHPGGPFWARKDTGAWTIPKGEYEASEKPFDAAKREFREETGVAVDGKFAHLGEFGQPSGKVLSAWAIEGDLDAGAVRSNTFELEWPAGSGKRREYPEVDRAAWFTLAEAKQKILKGQVPLLQRLADLVRGAAPLDGSKQT